MDKRKPQIHHYCNRFHLRWPDYIKGRKKPKNRSRSLPKGISREEAEKRRQAFCIDLDNVTWQKWCENDLETHSSKVRPRTIEGISRVYAHVNRICAPNYLKDINFESLQTYRLERYKEGCEGGTLNTELAIIKAAFNRAIKRDIVDYNPVDKDLMSRPKQKSIIILSSYQYQLLLESAPTFDWELVLAIGFHTGLRIGEILALNTWDVHPEYKMLTVSNSIDHTLKSGKGRQIPLSPEFLEYYYKRLERGGPGRMIGSISLKPGGQCSYNVNNAIRGFARICEKAGLVNSYGKNIYTSHVLRRTCITYWVRCGCTMDQVKDLAGHATIATTAKYYCQPSNVFEIQIKLDQKWNN